MTAAPSAKASEIGPGQMRVVEVRGVRIALCNVDGTFFAVEDVCTHDDGPLADGRIDGHEVECPRHGGRFDVRSGAATRMPAVVAVRTFPVRVQDGDIYIEVEDHGA